MAHELTRLISSIYNQPLLVSESQLNSIEEYLDMRNGNIEAVLDNNKREIQQEELRIENGIGVVSVKGAITSKANLLYESFCGMVSYETILSKVNTLCDMEDVNTILIEVDSGGGEALNMCTTSKEIRQLCNNAGKRLVGFVNGCAASAGYGILSSVEEIVMTSDSQVGAIGVLLALRNTNKRDEKEGISTTYITSGSEKIPYDKKTMEFRQEWLDDLQERVDEMYIKFTTLVSEHRGISVEDVKNTEARMYSANKALELGLVDKIMEPSEFYDYISSSKEDGESDEDSVGNKISEGYTSQTKVTQMSKDTQTIDMAAFEAMAAKLEQFEKAEAARELSAKKDQIKESLSGATFLSNLDSVVEFMVGAEESQASLLTSIIGDATAALSAQKEEAAAELAEKVEEFSAEKKDLETKLEAAEKAKEAVKEEFAKPEAIRGEEKQENLEALDHKEKLARAVAAAKAKKAQ